MTIPTLTCQILLVKKAMLKSKVFYYDISEVDSVITRFQNSVLKIIYLLIPENVVSEKCRCPLGLGKIVPVICVLKR